MTSAKSREELLEDLATRVERSMDHACFNSLKKARKDRAVLGEIATRLLANKTKSWPELDILSRTASPHEVMMEVLETYFIPAQQQYSDRREDRRVTYYVNDLRLDRQHTTTIKQKGMVHA